MLRTKPESATLGPALCEVTEQRLKFYSKQYAYSSIDGTFPALPRSWGPEAGAGAKAGEELASLTPSSVLLQILYVCSSDRV